MLEINRIPVDRFFSTRNKKETNRTRIWNLDEVSVESRKGTKILYYNMALCVYNLLKAN